MKRPDHDGSRCAYGEVALKFVVKVNVAREVRMPYHFFKSISIVPVLGLTEEGGGGSVYHCDPYVNPPIRKKSMHNGTLRWKHIRVLFFILRFALFGC